MYFSSADFCYWIFSILKGNPIDKDHVCGKDGYHWIKIFHMIVLFGKTWSGDLRGEEQMM
jgi:hypothetical protein